MNNPDILAQIPPFLLDEGYQHNIRTKVRNALDLLLERLKAVNDIWELVNYDVMMDSILHTFGNEIDTPFYEKVKEAHRIAVPDYRQWEKVSNYHARRSWHNRYVNQFVQFVNDGSSDDELNRMIQILCTFQILSMVIPGLYNRGILRFDAEGILLEPVANTGELIQIATRWFFDFAKGNSIVLVLANHISQHITISEAAKIVEVLEDIIEDRDKYLFSEIDKIYNDKDTMEVPRSFILEETFKYDSELASLFIFLEKREAAILALDVGKTKCLRNRHECANSHEMSKTWEMIREGKEKTRLREISEQLKQHEENATVLVYHVDRRGILHCCVLNGEVKLITFPQLDREDLISQMEMLLKPCNVQVRRDFSFVTNPREETENSTSTCTEGRHRKPSKMTNKSMPKTLSEIATLEINKFNAIWASKNLFTLLLQPLKDFIMGKKLIIVPDQYLFFLPFSSLSDENGNSLSMNYSIQIVPTIHHLLSSFTDTPDSNSIGPAMFVGNPKLDIIDRDGKPLRPLPHASDEARQLAAMFNTNAVIGDEATLSKVERNLDQVSIFHVASHADPTFGWIYLAPDFTAMLDLPHSEEEEAYMFEEFNLFGCQMKARLVFLSCCSTARGAVSKNGVFGMARAFLTAGARSVVVTLWPIDDLITLEFAQKFYSFLCVEKSVCEALQLTKIHFETSGNPALKFYKSWAAFQVFGEDIKFTKEEIEKIRTLGTRA